MSVSKVKVVSIIGMLDNLDKVIKVCGESKFFQPDDAMCFYATTDKFAPISEKNPYTMMLQILRDTMISSGVSPETVDIEDFQVDKDQINEYVNAMSSKLGALVSKKNDIIKSIEETKTAIDEISHFTGLNLNLKEIFDCKFIKVRFGRIPKEGYLKLNSYSDNPYVLFFPCTSDSTHYWGVYFAPIDNVADVDRIFAGLYFERTWIPAGDGTPEERQSLLRYQVNDYRSQLDEINRKISSFWKVQKDQCMRFYSKLKELDTYFGIKKYVLKYKNSFILVGWIPAKNENEFISIVDSLDGIEYSIENADKEMKHSPPVKLKNNRLFKPFEFFVKMYGLPSYGEPDPTPFVGITYMLLFGIMFGDFGQGIVLSIVGHLMWKLKKMELGRIMVRCGFMASVFGLIYGEFFGYGHLFDHGYKMLGFTKGKPFEIMESPNQIILGTIAFGIVLIVLSMLVNIFSSLKRKDYENALFGQNGLAGLTFYTSLIAGATLQVMFSMKVFTLVYIICLIALPVVLMFFKEPLGKLVKHDPNWAPEKWGEYILQNSFELFEILLSFVSNTISFLRIGAYALVHVGLMSAVYTIAAMAGSAWSIGYIIVVILGNVFVMVLEGLLSGIQALRLEFYEIFSRFFSGQGRQFIPVTART